MLTKQELENTYILNDRGELFDLYMQALKDAGAVMCAAISRGNSCKTSNVVYYDRLGGMEYTVKLSGDFEGVKRGLTEITLADLRKKQGKTVVDAVNYYRGEQEYDVFLLDGEFTTNSKIARESGGYRICMITEFNQCVKEMSYHAGMGEYNNYLDKHSPLEPVKPRTNIEYVKVDKNAEGGAYWECAREFAEGLVGTFWRDGRRGMMIQDNEQLLIHYKANNLYRKVETEITWQDEAKELLIPATRQYMHNNGIGFLCGYDCDETVQIVADLIEKCHQQNN